MVQFGPSDYSISIGKAGQGASTEVQKIQRDMIELALEKNVAPRVELRSFEQTKPFIDMGVRHFCIGWDVRTIFEWCEKQSEGMRDILASV